MSCSSGSPVLCSRRQTGELVRGELATSVYAKRPELGVALHLRVRLDLLEIPKRHILALQYLKPHVSAEIVNYQQKVLVTAGRRQSDWTAQVTMHQLERALCAV